MTGSRVVRTPNAADRQIRAFFLEALEAAVANQSVRAGSPTIAYIADLLTYYARSRNFFERTGEGIGLRPLAEYYGRAVRGVTAEERARALRRLGDVALFVAGLLADSLNRKLVDVDYYIAMGGSAYGQLANQPTFIAEVDPGIYAELAQKFGTFVDVLDEVGERSIARDNSSLLRTYERWIRTGSPRAARRLRRHGVLPARGSLSRRRH